MIAQQLWKRVIGFFIVQRCLPQVLERAGVRGTVMDAVQASAERAAELGARK